MTRTGQAVISTRNLTRYYGQRVGIQAVDLDIRAGEIFGFLGPNGAGKSTAIRLLLGFLRPSGGQASIFGWNCWKQRAQITRRTGYLPGDLRVYPWMTLRKALQISGLIRGMDLSDAGHELAERFRLEANLPVRKMSRGMRQKLGLILALAHKPNLLVLDEPTSGLDPLMQDALSDLLRTMSADGCTVFFSSHTLSEVEQLCDRVAIVRNGTIVSDATLESLRTKALRSVILIFQTAEAAAEATEPDCLTVNSRSGRRWECDLTGPSPLLIEWAANQLLEDIEIGQPELENLFRKFYRPAEIDR
jgi:ABC-2 type transport system ATP-binding protein